MVRLKVKKLVTGLEKTKGLIGQVNIKPVYFETRFGIHTFGMLKAIDVYILDKESRAVRIRKNLSPNSVFFWNPKFYGVLETPVNLLKVKAGDKILLSYLPNLSNVF